MPFWLLIRKLRAKLQGRRRASKRNSVHDSDLLDLTASIRRSSGVAPYPPVQVAPVNKSHRRTASVAGLPSSASPLRNLLRSLHHRASNHSPASSSKRPTMELSSELNISHHNSSFRGVPLDVSRHNNVVVVSTRTLSYTGSRANDLVFPPAQHLLTDANHLAGGFSGKVYVVPHKESTCALKVLSIKERKDLHLDFLKECALLSQLSDRHENIVKLLSSYQTAEKGYIYLELCEGLSLDSWIAPPLYLLLPDSYADQEASTEPNSQAQAHAIVRQSWSTFRDYLSDHIRSVGRFENYSAIIASEHPILESSSRGQRVLSQVAAGTRLVSINDSRSSSMTGSPHRLRQPLLVACVGPNVYTQPVALTDSPSLNVHRIAEGLMSLCTRMPFLNLLQRVRIACEAFRACRALHSTMLQVKESPCGEEFLISDRPIELLDDTDPGRFMNVVHSDIKPQNILLTRAPELKVKLSDAGLSFLVDSHAWADAQEAQPLVIGNKGGTNGYQDPYTKSGAPVNRFGTKNDVYSFGVVLLDIFPPALDSAYPWFGPLIARIEAKCLEQDWDLRCDSAELMDDMETLYAVVKEKLGANNYTTQTLTYEFDFAEAVSCEGSATPPGTALRMPTSRGGLGRESLCSTDTDIAQTESAYMGNDR